MILQNIFYGQETLLMANGYPDGVVYYLLQDCQSVGPGYSDCQMTFYNAQPVWNLYN